MASFFQPGKDDPTRDACGEQKYQVYCNSVLPAGHRFIHLFQVVNFTFGLTATFVPLILYLVYRFIQSRKARRPKASRQVLICDPSFVILSLIALQPAESPSQPRWRNQLHRGSYALVQTDENIHDPLRVRCPLVQAIHPNIRFRYPPTVNEWEHRW